MRIRPADPKENGGAPTSSPEQTRGVLAEQAHAPDAHRCRGRSSAYRCAQFLCWSASTIFSTPVAPRRLSVSDVDFTEPNHSAARLRVAPVRASSAFASIGSPRPSRAVGFDGSTSERGQPASRSASRRLLLAGPLGA
ncbi:hypothetical protein OEIGOIKO_08209 [Streptomyces chrestomyceticus JCM 4735]|uniref:Uncharacterized protein n=1 Tax=Streptomyces chrestomyceticus JCM 4735 TaxID=1306181 RepID=A0A7U9L3I9_9ACTN|nr:hypothetical protein OEIGOIKO_08209 [Streptomyces chrestomyceticus JCM 4735]